MAHSARCTSAANFAAMAIFLATAAAPIGAANAEDRHSFLEHIRKHVTLTTTVPENGDQNPYAIVVAPVSAGKIQKDDVLIDNFNDLSNLQRLGPTIVHYN